MWAVGRIHFLAVVGLRTPGPRGHARSLPCDSSSSRAATGTLPHVNPPTLQASCSGRAPSHLWAHLIRSGSPRIISLSWSQLVLDHNPTYKIQAIPRLVLVAYLGNDVCVHGGVGGSGGSLGRPCENSAATFASYGVGHQDCTCFRNFLCS